jgi:hypothetical protein
MRKFVLHKSPIKINSSRRLEEAQRYYKDNNEAVFGKMSGAGLPSMAKKLYSIRNMAVKDASSPKLCGLNGVGFL